MGHAEIVVMVNGGLAAARIGAHWEQLSGGQSVDVAPLQDWGHALLPSPSVDKDCVSGLLLQEWAIWLYPSVRASRGVLSYQYSSYITCRM